MSSKPERSRDKERRRSKDDDGALMVGPNYKVGKKLGSGNFGELHFGAMDAHPFTSHLHVLCIG